MMDQVQAETLLREVDDAPTVAALCRAAARLDALRAPLARVDARCACLSSFTFDPLLPALQLQAVRAGIGMQIYTGPFGQFEQELIDPASGLATFKPDVVILTLRLQDMCAELYDGFAALTEADVSRLIDDWIERLGTALSAYRDRAGGHILIQNYDAPADWSLGIADGSAVVSQRGAIGRANAALNSLAESMTNVRVMDYDALVSRHGRAGWTDPRLAAFARIPIAPRHYWSYAGFIVRHLRPLYGLSKKVLVLDADNTLWGGVVGDVGRDGIALGNDYPGNAHVAFQQRVLDLHHRGVILCIASKNEAGAVEDVLKNHAGMVLGPDHIAALRVNWEPKPDNLRLLAEELNLGLDSFVFMDDSPVECEMMRTALPEVMTIHLPAEPAAHAGVIAALDCFDQWSLSAEDRGRGKLYKAEAERSREKSTAVDLPTFYRGLEMKVSFSIDAPGDVVRAAQMTQRTNQFNMHTTRCTEDDIRAFMAAGDSRVITLALADRFGDNGIVGLAVVRVAAEAWTLRLFLMSCRVLGRTVEQGFVAWIGQQARAAGAARLVGEFAPTAKNKPFAGFYESCGFTTGEADGETQHWTWPLDSADTTIPDWIDVTVNPAGAEAP